MTEPPLRLIRSTFGGNSGAAITRKASAGLTCAMCGIDSDVLLCSFAFAQVHRRVPLCPEHRAPLVEIDDQTRLGLGSNPASAAAANMWSGRVLGTAGKPSHDRFRNVNRTRPMPASADGATVTVLRDRLR